MNESFAVQEAPAAYRVMQESPRVKAGYKQTEVGVIPEDWAATEIGLLNPFITSGSRGWAEFYSDFGSPFIRITNMSRESIYLDLADLKQVKLPSDATEGKRTQLQNDDVLISITADIGIAGFVDGSVTKPAYINQHIALVRFNASSEVDSKFVAYFLASEGAQRRFLSSTDQGAKAGMTLGRIKKVQLVLPPLPEQRAIATALSDVDALLAAQDKLIAKKRDIKQAAMQQLLTGKQRLPGFSGEWEVKRLGDVATFYKGKGLPKSALSLFGAEPCIHYGELFTLYPETILEIISRTDTSGGTFRSASNDVLMPTSDVTPRGLAKASCVRTDGVILGGDILVIRSDQKLIWGSFLSYLIRFEEEQILQLVTGSTVFHLYGSDMKKFTFSMPSLAEQTAIAAVLSDMDADLAALEQQRDKTRALKQGMMQALLTGRIRLV